MKKLYNILLAVCLLFAALGFLDVGGNILVGFTRAIASVSFILAFITRIIEKAEAETPKRVESRI